MAKIVGVISVKGGVGKTTAVANLGAILSKEYKKRVLIVDANYTVPNVALHFGMIDNKKTLHEVLDGKLNVGKAIIPYNPYLHLLPASLSKGKAKCERLSKVLSQLRSIYDIILIDSAPSDNEELLSVVNASDELFVVTTPDHVTLSMTLQALKIAREKRVYVNGLILNKVKNRKYELDMQTIEKSTDVPVVAVLNKEEYFVKSLAEAEPSAYNNAKRDSIVEYTKLAGALLGVKYKDKRLKTFIKSLFSRNIKKEEINRTLMMESHY